MSNSLRAYISSVRNALERALCIQCFPSMNIERHNAPEIETRESPELLLPSVTIERTGGKECCLIEPSVNSVRVSLRVGQADALEEALVRMYMRFIMQRAESMEVLRRVPIQGYDVSFLITDAHVTSMGRQRLVDFICGFIEDMDRETSMLKLAVNARGRAVATQFLRSLAY